MEWLLTIYYFICLCLNFLCIHDIEICSFSFFYYALQTSTTVIMQSVSTEEHAVME